MGNASRTVAAEIARESGKNPLDTTFGPHSRRASRLRNEVQGGMVEFSESALKEIPLSTISNLGRIAERYPNALKYFPQGSKLTISASADWGGYCEESYRSVYCELKFPTAKGGFTSSGREEIHRLRNADSVESAFEKFLQLLENKQLDSD